MTPAEAEALVPIAAELIATIRDYSPADVAAVLDRVPDHRALAVVLAAMVDPDARPSELLAWVSEPVQSRGFTPATYSCQKLAAEDMGRRAERRAAVGRLSDAGLSIPAIAEQLGISPRAVVRHRTAIREALEKAS